MQNKNLSEETKILGFILYTFIFVILFTFLALTAWRGLENPDNFQRWAVYIVMIVALGIVVILDKLLMPRYNFTFLHEPENGLLGMFKVKIPFIQNPISLLLISFLFFAPFFFYIITIKQTSLIAFYSFQIFEGAKLWLSAEPAVTAETLILTVVFGIGYALSRKFSNNGRNEAVFFFGAFISLIFTTALMVLYHTFRYSGNDIALFNVALFFFFSVFLLWLTGSIIPLLIIHFLNNFLGEARNLFSSDLMIVVFGIIYVVILILAVVYWSGTLSKKGRRMGI